MLRPVAFALSAGFLVFVAAMPAHAAGDAEAQDLEARHGAVRYSVKTVDPPSRIDTGGAAVFVAAPIATVRKIVTDYRHYEKVISTFEQSRLLSRKAGVSEIYLQVPVMHGAATIWTVARVAAPVKDGAGEAISARMVKSNVSDFRAVWRLRAVDAAHTVLKLELLVDPDMPVPKSLVVAELQSAADRGVSAVRDRAEEMAKAVAAAPAPAPTPAPTAKLPPREGKPADIARR